MRTSSYTQIRQARDVFRRHGYVVKVDRQEPGRFVLSKDGRRRQVEAEELLIVAAQLTRLEHERELA
jgi:hypothetical protein